MVEGRRREAWGHTGSLLAMIYNALSKHPLSPEDFNPYSTKHKRSPKKENVSILRDILFDKDAKYKVGR